MFHPAAISVVLAPGVLRLGTANLSLTGIFLALGILAAVLLSQFTAPKAGVSREDILDIAFVALLTASIASRLLLILAEPHAFFRSPLLVLSQPSFTPPALALTLLAVLAFLALKRLSLRTVLDALTPGLALGTAVAALLFFLTRPSNGMPTSLPWAVPTSHGLVHPTVLYSCIVALIVLAVSLRQIHQPHRKGFVFARGLWIAGIGGYLRQLVTQPANPTGHTLLEPRQIAAVVFLAIGLSVELPTLLRRLRSTPQPHLAEIVAINRAA